MILSFAVKWDCTDCSWMLPGLSVECTWKWYGQSDLLAWFQAWSNGGSDRKAHPLCLSLSLICKTNVRCIQPWALGAAYPWEADLAESINAVSCIEHDVPAHKFQTFCTTTGGCIPLPFQQWLTASEDICWLWQANQVLDISLEPVRWIFWVKSGVHWTDPTLFICHGLSKLCMDLRLSSIS